MTITPCICEAPGTTRITSPEWDRLVQERYGVEADSSTDTVFAVIASNMDVADDEFMAAALAAAKVDAVAPDNKSDHDDAETPHGPEDAAGAETEPEGRDAEGHPLLTGDGIAGAGLLDQERS